MQDFSFSTLRSFSCIDWISGFILVSAIVIFFYLLKFKSVNDSRAKTIRFLGLLLGQIVGSIALLVLLFSFWNHRNLIDVTLGKDGINTPYGTALYSQIKDAKITTDRQSSLANPNIIRSQTRLLLIMQTNNKVHVLSEDDYNITEILRALRNNMKAYHDSDG